MTTQDMVCCPFCGSEDVHLGHGRFDEWFVECYKCHACGPWFCLADRSEAQESAVFFWNAYGKVSDFVQQSHINRDRWLSARYAIEAWLIKHKEAFARLGVSLSGWFVEKNDDVAAIGKSCEELADKLNPWWRVQLYVEHPEQMTILASSEPGPLWYAKLRKALEPIKEALADESVLGLLQSTMQVHGGQAAIDDLRSVFATEPECSATELCLVVEKPRKPHSVGDALADEELLEVIERWQLASGLCSPAEEHGGDPGGVTPDMAQQHWEEVEKQRDEFQGKLAEADHALIQAGVGEDSSVALRIEKLDRERDEVRSEIYALRNQVERLQRGNTIESDYITRREEALAADRDFALARAEKAEREREDTVPAHIHEELRQVMLGERRRAEKAELRLQHLAQEGTEISLSCVVPHPSSHAYRFAALLGHMRRRAEKAERERDAALARVRELEAEVVSVKCEQLATDRLTEAEIVLARAQEALKIGSDGIGYVDPRWFASYMRQRLRAAEADAEELAAFRWLARWLKEKSDKAFEYTLGTYERDLAIFICGNLIHARASTMIALAVALDPNWRKAGSKED